MNGAHLHLVLNHLPVFTIPIALVFVFYSLIKAKEAVLTFSLWVLLLTLLTTAAAFFTGEPAEKIVEHLDFVATSMIHPHEEAAELSIWLAGVSAFLTAVAIKLQPSKRRLLVVQLVIATTLMTLASLAYTSSLGGQIHHPEIDIQPQASQL